MSHPLPIDALPSVERLRDLFDMSDDGRLFWKIPCRGRPAGARAGTNSGGGYRAVKISRRLLKEHRVVFALANGRWPIGYIDHIDGNPSNNRPENLREATPSQNMQNMRPTQNATGFAGVYEIKSGRSKGRYQAKLRVGGKGYFSKVLKTAEEAHAAYLEMKGRLHPFAARVRG